MAFTAESFLPGSAMANSNAPRQFQYKSAVDNIAAIKASGYFDNAALPTGGLGLQDEDVIYIQGTDGESFIVVAVSGPGVVTVTRALNFA